MYPSGSSVVVQVDPVRARPVPVVLAAQRHAPIRSPVSRQKLSTWFGLILSRRASLVRACSHPRSINRTAPGLFRDALSRELNSQTDEVMFPVVGQHFLHWVERRLIAPAILNNRTATATGAMAAATNDRCFNGIASVRESTRAKSAHHNKIAMAVLSPSRASTSSRTILPVSASPQRPASPIPAVPGASRRRPSYRSRRCPCGARWSEDSRS